jgi:hypothetical protein
VLALQGTDFSTWSEADIKAFLDQRGGDFDDCTTFQQLVSPLPACMQYDPCSSRGKIAVSNASCRVAQAVIQQDAGTLQPCTQQQHKPAAGKKFTPVCLAPKTHRWTEP